MHDVFHDNRIARNGMYCHGFSSDRCSVFFVLPRLIVLPSDGPWYHLDCLDLVKAAVFPDATRRALPAIIKSRELSKQSVTTRLTVRSNLSFRNVFASNSLFPSHSKDFTSPPWPLPWWGGDSVNRNLNHRLPSCGDLSTPLLPRSSMLNISKRRSRS